MRVPSKRIDEIFEESSFQVYSTSKTTIVVMKLPNGFELTESSACVDETHYDEKIGTLMCKEKLRNKVWELEGYMLQEKLHKGDI